MSLTKQQLERRKTAVGASEIAVLAGLSKWSSPVAIYEAKVLGRQIESTYSMELGNELEAPIARAWAKLNNRHLALVDTLASPTYRYAIATPDRAVYLDAASRGDARKKRTVVTDAECLLQVKSTNWRMRRFWGDADTDNVPDEYLCQAHWEGAVAGVSQVVFAVDFDKTELVEYRVTVDMDVFGGLYEIAARFMRDHVEARKPPPPDGTEVFTDYLKRAFPRDEQPALVDVPPGSDPELERAVAEFLMLKQADKRVKAWKETAYQTIASRIGTAAGIKGAFGSVTWKRTRDGQKVQWKAMADEALMVAQLAVQTLPAETGAPLMKQLSELYAKHTQVTPGHRTMRTTPAEHLQFDSDIEIILSPPKPSLIPTAAAEELAP